MKPWFLIIVFLIARNGYSQMPVIYSNFPLLIDSAHGPTAFSSLLSADLDKDGSKEIIFASDGKKLRVVKNNAQYLNGFPKYYNSYIRFISCGDVDGDNSLDIIVRTEFEIYVYDNTGNILPGFPVNITSNGRQFASIFDLDNDGKLEIIADVTNGLIVFNFNGQIKNGWPLYNTGTSYASPAMGDIDYNGNGEIILSTRFNNAGVLRILKHDGTNYSQNWPVTEDSTYYNETGPPTLYIKQSSADSTFIIVSSNYGDFQSNKRSRITKYDIHGNIVKRRNFYMQAPLGQVIMSKLDNDIYFGCGDIVEVIFILRKDFSTINDWSGDGTQANYRSLLFGKLQNGSENNIVSNWSSASTYYGYGFNFAYNTHGELIDGYPLRTYGLNISHAYTDIDNDGSVEYIQLAMQHDKTFLKIFTFPGIPFTAENHSWPIWGHDRFRTNQYGFIPPDELIGIEYISSETPDNFELSQNYPNPFNASTVIKFSIKNDSYIKLSIFDITGRVVNILIDKALTSGSYKMIWNANKLSSGVYFYELESTDKNKKLNRETKKAVILK